MTNGVNDVVIYTRVDESIQGDGKQFRIISQIILTVTKYENGATIKCEADNTADEDLFQEDFVSDEILLEVQYEPDKAILEASPPIAVKGHTVTLKCSVEDRGNPVSTK